MSGHSLQTPLRRGFLFARKKVPELDLARQPAPQGTGRHTRPAFERATKIGRVVKVQVALYLYQVKGYSNDQVASHLHFHDATNFRRSFKRWTGVPPSALRRWLTGEV